MLIEVLNSGSDKDLLFLVERLDKRLDGADGNGTISRRSPFQAQITIGNGQKQLLPIAALSGNGPEVLLDGSVDVARLDIWSLGETESDNRSLLLCLCHTHYGGATRATSGLPGHF